MAERDYARRIKMHLEAADRVVAADCRALVAELSAKGLLQSGATLKRAVAIWNNRNREAFHAASEEIGRVIDHRGRNWDRAMRVLLREVETRRSAADPALASTFLAAGAQSGEASSAMELVAPLLDEGVDAMRNDALAFRDGWTSPRGKAWNERHPFWFAVLLLLAGALATEVFRPIVSAVTSLR